MATPLRSLVDEVGGGGDPKLASIHMVENWLEEFRDREQN